MSAGNSIPPITDPMGAGWRQPSLDQILVDDTHALMTESTFQALPEYSASNPSGVYEGKMWRRHDGLFDPSCPAESRRWLLCWFGPSDDPRFVSNNYREVLVVSP